MLANASNGLKTLGAIDLLQIARFAKGCIALSEGTEDARDHPRWYISAPLGEATKKKSSIYSLPLCKPLQGRFPAGWYPGIGRGGKSVYTAFWVAQGAGMKSRGGKAGGGDFAQAKYYPFTP